MTTKSGPLHRALTLLGEAKVLANTDDAERFDERVGDVVEIEGPADALLEAAEALDSDMGSDLGKHAEELAGCVKNAGSVEKEADLDANLKDALHEADALQRAIVAAQKEAKADGATPDQLEALKDLASDLRAVVKSLKEV